jgi:hypothetical protein
VVAWWAVLEGGRVIFTLEAPSLAQAEHVAALKYPTTPITVRLWSACTVSQRAAARASLPECRLIEGA